MMDISILGIRVSAFEEEQTPRVATFNALE